MVRRGGIPGDRFDKKSKHAGATRIKLSRLPGCHGQPKKIPRTNEKVKGSIPLTNPRQKKFHFSIYTGLKVVGATQGVAGIAIDGSTPHVNLIIFELEITQSAH